MAFLLLASLKAKLDGRLNQEELTHPTLIFLLPRLKWQL
jgi:hypothetical protein